MRTWTKLLIAIGGLACTEQPPSPELSLDHRDALHDSLAAFSEAMFALARARDVEGTLSLYSGRPDFTHIDNGVLVDWPTLEAGIRSTFAQISENDIRWVEPPRILVLNRDIAVIVGTHRFGGGAGIPPHDGLWTGVLQRDDGAWKIAHSHSSDAPGR